MAYDENFADSGQVAAERGENMSLTGQLTEQLAEVDRALAKLDDGTYGLVRGLRQPDRRGAPRGHARHQVLYRARLTAARGGLPPTSRRELPLP